MDSNEMAVKEINQYYVRRGGRSPLIKNYANTGDFAARMKKTMAAGRTAATAQTPQDVSDLQKDATGVQKGTSGEDAGQADKDFCCDTCLQTSQLTMQLWRNLYLRSALGGYSAGAGSLANLVTGTGSPGSLSLGAGTLASLASETGALTNLIAGSSLGSLSLGTGLNVGAGALANLIAGANTAAGSRAAARSAAYSAAGAGTAAGSHARTRALAAYRNNKNAQKSRLS